MSANPVICKCWVIRLGNTCATSMPFDKHFKKGNSSLHDGRWAAADFGWQFWFKLLQDLFQVHFQTVLVRLCATHHCTSCQGSSGVYVVIWSAAGGKYPLQLMSQTWPWHWSPASSPLNQKNQSHHKWKAAGAVCCTESWKLFYFSCSAKTQGDQNHNRHRSHLPVSGLDI